MRSYDPESPTALAADADNERYIGGLQLAFALSRSDEAEKLSECCGARPLGEVHDGFAFCSDCRDMAHFPSTEEGPQE